jgi:hypothetical protein
MFDLGFKHLELFGIPVPRYALVIREVPSQELDYFIEEEDFVEVHGMRFWKPFVEKPVDGKLVYTRLKLFNFNLFLSFDIYKATRGHYIGLFL